MRVSLGLLFWVAECFVCNFIVYSINAMMLLCVLVVLIL